MKPALLLVDLQNDYLALPGLQPGADVLVSRAASLLKAAREGGVPVIHVWTTVRREDDRRLPHWRRDRRWMCEEGTPGHRPPSPLEPLTGETIVHKTGFNAFADPVLETSLRRSGCDTLFVTGLHLHACVRTLAVESLERGWQVSLADDAVATNDPLHAAATRRWLAERCVGFLSANEVLHRLRDQTFPAAVHRSPRNLAEVLFELPNADRNEVALAATAAQKAAGAWSETPWPVRQRLLEETAARLESLADDLAKQMAIDIGKPVSHGREEVRRSAANIRDVLRRAAPDKQKEGPGRVRLRPLGVVAVISAWNNPVAIPMGKLAPALAYGNTVVWKPAPAATRLSQTLLQLLRNAGLPPDAVRLVAGGHDTAQFLAADENVDAVTLTGSLMAGCAIQEICARRLIPLQAELSGNNAAIVWDADPADAAAQVAWGAFAFAGQRCTANRRVIVPATHFENFLKQLIVAAEKLPWGDPLNEATEIGPVISPAKRDELAALISQAGADRRIHRVVPLRRADSDQPWVKAGAYAAPAIVGCDQPDHPLVQEETMGPLLIVQRAEDFDHALKLCNGVRHGLAAALFSGSAELQKRFLAEARAGILKLNAATAGVDVTLPFGGWKASGIGPPEHGEGDRLFYTKLQAVYGA